MENLIVIKLIKYAYYVEIKVIAIMMAREHGKVHNAMPLSFFALVLLVYVVEISFV